VGGGREARAFAQEDVRRLDVPVDDAQPVSLRERAEQRLGHLERPLLAQRPRREHRLERSALQQLEGDERRPVLGGPRVEHADRARVGQPHRQLSLAAEASGGVVLQHGPVGQDLERDGDAVAHAGGAMHGAEAATADLVLEPVAADDDRASGPARPTGSESHARSG
jgi:hypothetical protein